jgi:hypothetical protein
MLVRSLTFSLPFIYSIIDSLNVSPCEKKKRKKEREKEREKKEGYLYNIFNLVDGKTSDNNYYALY